MDRLTLPRKQEKEKKINETMEMYTTVSKIQEANIFHVYPLKEYGFIKNKGYHDSQLFNVIAFNSVTREKCNLNCKFDAIKFRSFVRVILTQIFIDGAFLVKTDKPEIFEISQILEIGK